MTESRFRRDFLFSLILFSLHKATNCMNVAQVLNDLSNIKVAVIGDVMLDTYCWGKVERISPEAPVPVVSLDKKEVRIGGAGNVALNTASLGAATFIFSVIGQDEEGRELKDLMQRNNIYVDHLITSSKRITTNKTRIISRNQQMMRLDAEFVKDLDEELEAAVIEQFRKFVATHKPDVVILEDYNKGVLTEKLVAAIIAISTENNIATAVDPKRKNFFAYRGATIFKPNLKEVKEALNLLFEEIDTGLLNNIHLQLQQTLKHDYSLITLSEHGMFYAGNDRNRVIPSHRRNIADVSGAGDTVIAVASLVYAASKDINLAAEVANIAGGLVCEEVGTVAIDKEKLLRESKTLLG
jgi:D-glycero-beta-D-manno-heptose-7-phosphate kinase